MSCRRFPRTATDSVSPRSCGLDREEARGLLADADGHVKTALAMRRLGVGADEAKAALRRVQGAISALPGPGTRTGGESDGVR